MKRLINFRVIFILLIILSTSSCITNNILWVSDGSYEQITSFFIDKENNRVVLIGDAGYKTEEGTDHYRVTDKEGKIFKVFELAEKTNSKDVAIYFNQIRVRGSKIIDGTGWVSFALRPSKNLESEIKYLRKEKLVVMGKDKKVEYIHYDFNFSNSDKIKRYPSSKEKFTNFCSKINKDPNCAKIIKFERGWKGSIWEEDTTPKLIAKSIATPFTIAADIILIPVKLLIWVAVGIGGGA